MQLTVSEQVAVLPGLLASPSRTCSSVHSARECSRQSCRKRAWVGLTFFSRDSRATVCSHSFHPLNQLASTPTWSRNIMVCEAGWRRADCSGAGLGWAVWGATHKEQPPPKLYTDGLGKLEGGLISWVLMFLHRGGRGVSQLVRFSWSTVMPFLAVDSSLC